ncbi:hypothetical protein BpHYR1_042613 [Brachionus plicatilis]|uniref:Uncharacterized protein n=1 Tax=Brachionus plicatilis TaxID=10195 RepID=A0A3M7QNL9_BRAPC|nr:hypothetical protein BpHYR1_042613 [Brachionus plicatilis]
MTKDMMFSSRKNGFFGQSAFTNLNYLEILNDITRISSLTTFKWHSFLLTPIEFSVIIHFIKDEQKFLINNYVNYLLEENLRMAAQCEHIQINVILIQPGKDFVFQVVFLFLTHSFNQIIEEKPRVKLSRSGMAFMRQIRLFVEQHKVVWDDAKKK